MSLCLIRAEKIGKRNSGSHKITLIFYVPRIVYSKHVLKYIFLLLQEEKKRKREKEQCDTEGETDDFDPGKKVEVEPPPDRPVRACRTQPGEHCENLNLFNLYIKWILNPYLHLSVTLLFFFILKNRLYFRHTDLMGVIAREPLKLLQCKHYQNVGIPMLQFEWLNFTSLFCKNG